MKWHGIPTAEYKDFDNYEEAKAYLTSISHDVVIKADGLAAGKGVIIPTSKEEAIRALKNIMVNNLFGSAGSSVVIEEYLDGQEISVSTFSDGRTTASLPVGQDHKRLLEGDKGPNTGGMGVYAPVPAATSAVMETIENEILRPTFEGLRQQGECKRAVSKKDADDIIGRNFVGLLFTGIMLTRSGPKVLEYNARFGDPETQSIIPLLGEEFDLAEVMMACIEGRLDQVKIRISPMFACNVVIAAGGYPESSRRGDVVSIRPLPRGMSLFVVQ
jgi:phosphoribosylamine--glycine ligase / phosphoribosylformylglycinamidine cyclo-ligase